MTSDGAPSYRARPWRVRRRRSETFQGEICGFGTTSGHRFVIGRWPDSPFGPFADVMHEAPDGVRTLLAPSTRVAGFVDETYAFDRVCVVPVDVRRYRGRLDVRAGDLSVSVTTGTRTAVGRVLHAVPPPITRSPVWCTLIDPIARVLMRGVRTRGTAGGGRREWYGADDQHRLTSVKATLGSRDLGAMSDLWPPVRFGFSSAPRSPSMIHVTVTIRDAHPRLCPGRTRLPVAEPGRLG